MTLVLVVEDDLPVRMLHTRVLSRLQGVVAVAAASLSEAFEVIEHEEPVVVLLDIRLEDGSGLQLLQRLTERHIFPLIVVISAFLDDLAERAWPPSKIITMAKPADLDRLSETVATTCGKRARSDPFSPAEYVQLACLGRHNINLSLTGLESSGSITIREGEVWAARWGQCTGLEAFTSAVHRQGTRVEICDLPDTLPPRQLAAGWQDLLIESARIHDEVHSRSRPSLRPDELDFADIFEEVRQQSGAPPARAESEPARPALSATLASDGDSEHSALVEAGVRAVIGRRYGDAARLFERALAQKPDSRALQHRLQRLRQLGY